MLLTSDPSILEPSLSSIKSTELFSLRCADKTLKQNKTDYVLPRFMAWTRGEQAKDLRAFLKGMGFPVIKFHALRACFATQLLAKGTPPAIVMKICGWRDLKTMEFYIRVAGVDEKGATDCLSILPSEVDVMDNVASLFVI